MFGWIGDLWTWARAHDLPNWFSLVFSLAVWPLFLLWWHRRRVTSVFGLELHFNPGTIHIGPDQTPANNPQYPAVSIRFQNHTGSVVYISGPRIRNCSSLFPVTQAADRDIASDSYHLKFSDGRGAFSLREITLQTTHSAFSAMPSDLKLSQDFYSLRRSGLLRRILLRKYFILEYTAMVGSTRYLVATKY